ncbi:MAG: hypothetical protein KJZ57_00055 [Anaerolineales bacterium]|nr:hypothetical protein [Anaerolineales bacterium]
MRYAREVIDLLGAYPGRDFKPGAIVRYVAAQRRELVRPRLRIGVHRVLMALVESGQVERDPPGRYGSYAVYRWKTVT